MDADVGKGAKGSAGISVPTPQHPMMDRCRDRSRHSPYPNRRARFACENCRRKKARCPGERPACSLCNRLHQTCIYAQDTRVALQDGTPEQSLQPDGRAAAQSPDRESTGARLTAIEARLEQISANLGGAQPVSHEGLAPPPSLSEARHEFDLALDTDTVNDGIQLYFEHCCNQPCPLLDHLSRSPLSHRYSEIVLTAILALALRRSTNTSIATTHDLEHLSRAYSKRCWNLLIDAYGRFEFDESYFQALCLLSQVDYAEGRSSRARAQIALGLRLAQAQGMLNKDHYKSDDLQCRQHQEIVWSLFILDRMFTSRHIPNASMPATLYMAPVFTGGPDHPDQSDGIGATTASSLSVQNFLVVSLSIQMMRTWEIVTKYISESLVEDSEPIWHPKSTRTAICTQLLEYEMPSEPHTYASVGPVSRVLDAPQLIPYFRTWLFFQITHSGIHCCINHPFIIFIKARQNKSRIPLTFLQKAHKDSLIYASWVAKSISDMGNTNLDVLDPFLAFLVGIAASIHLEHSLNSNNSIASTATQKLETCRTYLVSVARVWPKVEKRIVALDTLRSRVGGRSALHYVEEEYDGAVPVRSMRHVSMSAVDEQLMWTLFDSSNEPSPNRSGPVNRSSGLGAEEFDRPFNDPVPQTRDEDVAIQSEPTLGLPPDIDLTVDWSDWSLLGLPWLAYFPSDTACL